MRTKPPLFSLLVLCGATAAAAQVVAMPAAQDVTNNMTMDNRVDDTPPLENRVTLEPQDDTSEPANTTDDAPPEV